MAASWPAPRAAKTVAASLGLWRQRIMRRTRSAKQAKSGGSSVGCAPGGFGHFTMQWASQASSCWVPRRSAAASLLIGTPKAASSNCCACAGTCMGGSSGVAATRFCSGVAGCCGDVAGCFGGGGCCRNGCGGCGCCGGSGCCSCCSGCNEETRSESGFSAAISSDAGAGSGLGHSGRLLLQEDCLLPVRARSVSGSMSGSGQPDSLETSNSPWASAATPETPS
mmetsp:Transcript_129548/g.276280  ORF Transcript_129548/g.276280 Transcript_129548/m.276280 type:complete len:224 (-) Transcript_129548:236-907(-)